jgi:hypothetical protein
LRWRVFDAKGQVTIFLLVPVVKQIFMGNGFLPSLCLCDRSLDGWRPK